MRHLVLAAILVLTAAGTAQAQSDVPSGMPTAHPLAEGGRYQLMDVNGKIVRLDTETGAFDLCRMEQGGWNCRMAEQERQGLEARVAQLETRVALLEAERLARSQREEQAAVADQQAQGEKGIVGRISGYVPGIGW